MSLLLELPELFEAKIIKRPSKKIKSPYVADIILKNDETQNELLGHTPSLGCCGLAEKDSNVLCSKLSEKTKCDYRIEISLVDNTYIGISPKLAENITENALKQNLIQHLEVSSIQREKKILNSRFDFIGKTTDDKHYILEVKTVPLIFKEDNKNISYFPDGYRKKKGAVVSERALKHINELREIKTKYPEIRCILLFVIQRNDSISFKPSDKDPIYLDALREAYKYGVEIRTIQVKWQENKCCYETNTLPILLFEDYNNYL